LATFGNNAAEKLRRKHKDNAGCSQTAEESASILAGDGTLALNWNQNLKKKLTDPQFTWKKFLHRFRESVFFHFCLEDKLILA